MTIDIAKNTADIRKLGTAITMPSLEGSQAVFAPHHEKEPYQGVKIARDLSYGPDERNRLDLFAPEKIAGKLPILVFVHGGGFVGGDKKRPGSPYQDNVALWAVHHGMIGINVTYRLAPQHQWPAGAEDVGAAVKFLIAHAAEHGGDPDRIFVMGTSAGAVHVASYVANARFHPAGKPAAAGAILLSGIYDLETAKSGRPADLYYGSDVSKYRDYSSLPGLIETKVPLMVVLAEFDPVEFERQALQLVQTYFQRHGHWPYFIRLMGHNHYTATLHLNSGDDYLGRQIAEFVRVTEAAS